MHEPDIHYETQVTLDIEETTQNLSQNLHLKWNYGLLYVDKFSDEIGLPSCIISGIRRQDETTFYIRINLTQQQKDTLAKIDIWKVNTAGWPFPKGVTTITTSGNDQLIDLVDEVLRFCQTPYEHTNGVMPWLRNIFTGRSETRKYKD